VAGGPSRRTGYECKVAGTTTSNKYKASSRQMYYIRDAFSHWEPNVIPVDKIQQTARIKRAIEINP
jgi:hypothetical protein